MRHRNQETAGPLIRFAIRRARGAVMALVLASVISNLLMLTGPLFMLQVYDRVLTSRSLPTLWTLFALVVCLYVFYTVIEILRSRVMSRVAAAVDLGIADDVFRHEVETRRSGVGSSLLRDSESVRGFIGSPGPLAVLDLPWTPLYLLLVYLLHPRLGLVAVIGLIVVALLAVGGEFALRRVSGDLAQVQVRRDSWLRDSTRNTDALLAMGIVEHAQSRWTALTEKANELQRKSADRSGNFSMTTRGFRLLLQSAILAVGAFLVLRAELSPGVMIAASVITARALAPIEQIAGQWRGFTQARQAARRLGVILDATTADDPVELPLPGARLDVRGLVVQPPASPGPVLAGIDFGLLAGQAMAVIGPSGAGKTALVRALTGVWAPVAGSVRLDGAPLDQYRPHQMRSIVGYLPQQLDLIAGTVAENIAGFDPNASSKALVNAAVVAGAHEFILSLPHGYETELSEAGANLSAGQRQRLGLARALFGDPFLVVLDEPNSNLDHVGEEALRAAIRSCLERGAVVVLVAHRPAILEVADLVLHIERGRQVSFGPRDAAAKLESVPNVGREIA